jgi:tetratricopeptide (TPR) repeat protein
VRRLKGQDAIETLTHQRLSRWETHGEVPSQRYLRALCRLYETRPDRLGFGEDHDRSVSSEQLLASDPTVPGTARHPSTHEPLGSDLAGLDLVLSDNLRQRTRTLLAGSMNTDAINWAETRAEFYNQHYRRIDHIELTAPAMADFAELLTLLGRHQTSADRRRLFRSAAVIAGVMGVTSVDLGLTGEAYAWFRTGDALAREAEDRALRAWIRTRLALACLYYGNVESVVAATRAALAIAGQEPSIAAAMAPSVEARALARAGRAREATAALEIAQTNYARLQAAESTTGLYSFPIHKFDFYRENVLTRTGRFSEAARAQHHALGTYPVNDRVDPALIRLDQGLQLIQRGQLDEAMDVSTAALRTLPSRDRTGTVLAQAREVMIAVPRRYRRDDHFRDFVDLVAGTRSEDGGGFARR